MIPVLSPSESCFLQRQVFALVSNGSTNIPTIFHRALTRASEIHTHNTRFASNLNFYRRKANNNYGTSTFVFVSSKLWETILTNFKNLPFFAHVYNIFFLLYFFDFYSCNWYVVSIFCTCQWPTRKLTLLWSLSTFYFGYVLLYFFSFLLM